MREIKFRAWDKEGEYMFVRPILIKSIITQEDSAFGPVSSLTTGTEATPEEYMNTDGIIDASDERFVVMQYTGLKDKKGKEIYEGDVVKLYNEGQKWCGLKEVRFANNGRWLPRYMYTKPEQCEVIGNIYENPELTEK